MRKHFIALLVILVLTGYFLVGCGLLPSKPSLFYTSPCKAPCWENITPGVTTEQDALTIFAKFADRQGVSDLQDQSQDGYIDDIHFSLPNGGLILGETLNRRISVMHFEGEFEGPLTLEQAIQLFGEPESVLVETFGMYDQIILLNPTKGIAFGWPIVPPTFTPGVASGQAEINPNNKVGLVWFFDSTQYDQFLNAGHLGFSALVIKNNLHPWTGYGKINDKYWPPVTPSQ